MTLSGSSGDVSVRRSLSLDTRTVVSRLRDPTFPVLWNTTSRLVSSVVVLLAKYAFHSLSLVNVYNLDRLVKALERPKGIPLITLSNHISTIDDPVMWSPLKNKYLTQKDIRWSLVAHEVCYTNTPLAYFFMLTRSVPIVRGDGVYQEGVNFAIERLSQGDWVHVFPEGRINDKMEYTRFKWGVGRMIYECLEMPIVLPIHVIGLEQLLPPRPPYIIRPFKKVTINHGEPLALKHLVEELKDAQPPPEVARKNITDAIQLEAMTLKKDTEELHNKP
uniref:Tafazzin family protein n=1 Tax=Lygus hesperus TaxID=30085 RepID=A0A0A9VT80_LYGHE